MRQSLWVGVSSRQYDSTKTRPRDLRTGGVSLTPSNSSAPIRTGRGSWSSIGTALATQSGKGEGRVNNACTLVKGNAGTSDAFALGRGGGVQHTVPVPAGLGFNEVPSAEHKVEKRCVAAFAASDVRKVVRQKPTSAGMNRTW